MAPPTPITPDVVTPLLRAHLGADAKCRAATRAPLGNGQETWFLDVEHGGRSRQLVLRRTQPDGPLSWTDRSVEAAVMAQAAAIGLPVPRVHWTDTGDALGQPYMVMDHAPGKPATAGAKPAVVWRSLGEWLARLHLSGPTRATRQEGTNQQLARYRQIWRTKQAGPFPLIDALLACLTRNRPASHEPGVLLWGDPGAHNALIDAADNVTALLDWELTHYGDPNDDLGAAVWFAESLGQDPQPLLEGYGGITGRDIDHHALRWFTALACVTRSIMISTGAAAYVRGRTHAPTIAGLALDLPAEQLARAAALLGWGEQSVPNPPVPDRPDLEVLHPDGAAIDRGVSRFLEHEVLGHISDKHTRRGVKTTAVLLQVSALQATYGSALSLQRLKLRQTLLDDMRSDGIDVTAGLATLAGEVENDDRLRRWQQRVREYLLVDLALQRSVLSPLRGLYAHD